LYTPGCTVISILKDHLLILFMYQTVSASILFINLLIK